MSLYKVDGHVFSVDEFYTWTMGFVVLYRKGMLAHADVPRAIHDIMKDTDDKNAGKAIMTYLTENDQYMSPLIKLVQVGFTELATEKP
jgi:hypothetical protein